MLYYPKQKPHPGIEAKRNWLSDRLEEDYIFRKLNGKAVVFIEYAAFPNYMSSCC